MSEDAVYYSVEEWESEDGSVSCEFKTLEEAKKHAKKVVKKSSYGVKKVKVWQCVLYSEEKVKNPK